MEYSNTGAMRSPFSPRVRQSITGRRAIGLSAEKKKQSKFMQRPESQGDVIYKTPHTTIETFGLPLPVLVTEALTFASGEVSVRLSPCGWCWLVTGRRILAWPRDSSATSGIGAGPAAARELMLPQTDLAHKADLVSLFYEECAQMPSCIGVSPEGTIRYWPSIGQETVYVEVSCELQGQECEWLGERSSGGLLLATTTCTIVVLSPANVDGRATVTCRTLRPPSGWLGGIGRRVSLLFFGSMPAHADTKLVGVVCLPPDCPFDYQSSLVCWVGSGLVLAAARADTLHHHNIAPHILNKLSVYVHGDVNSLEITALDVKAGEGNGIVLLLAIMNVARSPEIRYAIAHIQLDDPSSPRISSVTSLGGWSLTELDEAPKFLPLRTRAVLYSSKYIAVVSSTISNDKVDYIDIKSEGDKILGAELCNGVPLFFSKKHGVLALTCADNMVTTPSLCESPIGSPCRSDMYEGNLSIYEIDPHEISLVTTDVCGKLKTAFVLYVQRENSAARSMVDELFPASATVQRDVDSALDRTVVKIAREMIDDIPNGDPRWKQRPGGAQTNIALGSSCALQIAAHLKDKQTAFTLFVEFLRSCGLWQRLGLVSRESGGGCVSTVSALASIAEQLTIAIALRKLQQGNDGQLIDAAIYQVVCNENPPDDPEIESCLSSGALSPCDVCYRVVSEVSRVLRALAEQPNNPQQYVATTNIIAEVQREVYKCRSQWQSLSTPPQLGPKALLPALVELQKRAISSARTCADATLRSSVYSSACTLTELILSSAQNLQHNSHTAHVYYNYRRDAILPFVEDGQTERAAALAEKFKDFELLIEMCVKNDDLDRLYHYIDKYINEGIAETAFAYLTNKGTDTPKLIRSLGHKYPTKLSAWLETAPQRQPLLALHHLSNRDYVNAAEVFNSVAKCETDSINRMATMASLAKLCLIVSDDYKSEDMIQKVESCLALCEQHTALPRDIRIHYGLDSEDSRVIPVDEIVQMYIDCEGKSLTEYDYKKALDLVDLVDDMERRDELRLKVWCACIRRDDWSSLQFDSPTDELQTKMFFRLIDLVHVMGGDLLQSMPSIDDVMSAPELSKLASDSKFHFYMKYAYETARNTVVEAKYTSQDNMNVDVQVA